ncbi:transcription antitermination protein NusB [Capnocytophaga gingivalis]|uniref:transcription antitermination protein NusB n=1 Tax=Capnocytophaga gingivalis TaxID=1017 RepID=UPI00288BE51C|nr:transcription antitermination protein NusB [Capnocytophaga gingivalis]
MLTRRHIRVKVMQAIYALHKEENHNLQRGESFLLSSMDNMYSLYISLMGLWGALQERSSQMHALSKSKFIRDENLSHTLFCENKALQLITTNEPLKEAIEAEKKLSWHTYNEYVNILYNKIVESQVYRRHSTLERSFQADKQLLIDLYMKVIAPNEELFDFLSDREITWDDDFPIINTLIVKILKGLSEGGVADFLPPLFKDKSDKDFAIELLRKAVLNDEAFHKYLVEKTPKWDADRIAELDAIMIKMGIAEFLKFPSIPVKVTLNEYVEIAKEYSTPKSSVFVNGILDTLSKDFQQEGKLKKIGRGLL